MSPLIELRGLTVEIPTPAGWIRPVDDVSFALDAGESLGLVGESGSGKSMLALALMGLLPPGARVRGEAWFSGSSDPGQRERRRRRRARICSRCPNANGSACAGATSP